MKKPACLLLCVFLAACIQTKLEPEEVERAKLSGRILQMEDERRADLDFFSPLLEHTDPRIRRRAALALGRIGHPKALPPLLRLLRLDPDLDVRQMAVFALGEIEDRATLEASGWDSDPQAYAALIEALRDTSATVRTRAAEALGKMGNPGAVPALLEAMPRPEQLRDRGATEQAGLWITALFRLNQRAATPAVLALARHPDPELRWQVANYFYRTRDPSGAEVLEGLLNDWHPRVRRHACRALGALQDPSASATLADKLEDPDPGVRIDAARALGNLGTPAGTPGLLRKLSALEGKADPPSVKLRAEIVQALGELRDPAAADALTRFLREGGMAATAAIVALAKIGSGQPEFFRRAAGFQPRTDGEMRAWVTALGIHASDEARKRLRELYQSPDERAKRARFAIVSALGSGRWAELDAFLLEALRDPDPIVRREAATALSRRQNSASFQPLQEALRADRDHLPDARLALLAAVARFPPSRSLPVLQFSMNDDDYLVRTAAARWIRQATGGNERPEAGPARTRMDKSVYAALATQLRYETVVRIRTNRGEIEILLYLEDAPMTADNFRSLADSGFYDNLTFLRVVPNFVIQGGDPRNDMEGGPGYSIRCEINQRPFLRGTVGMALSGKDTGGSQFFICLEPQPHLDGGYTAFGRVIGGIEAADRILPEDRILGTESEAFRHLYQWAP